MQLHTLVKITETRNRRLGMGHGSGRSKTSGRGTKGQKARRNIPLAFEGGALPLIKRLPFLRGKGKNYSLQNKPQVINLKNLHEFAKDSVVDVSSLVSHGLITEKTAKKYGVKILSVGELKTSLVIKVPVSASAKVKIEKAGGSVETT